MQRRATFPVAPARPSQGWELLFIAGLAAFTFALGLFGFVLAAVIVDDDQPDRRSGLASPGHEGGAGNVAGEGLAAPVSRADDARLQAAILDQLGADAGRFGVVVRRLSDGRGAAVNADRVFYAASTFKLAVLYEAERQRSLGLLDFNSRLALSSEDRSEDLGTLADLPVDEDGSLSIAEAVEAMIVSSDNASAATLMRLLGAAAIDETLASLGLRHTSVNTRDLPTTAGDMALLMEAIVRGTGVSQEARDHMRSLLLAQRTRDGIPAGLPAGTSVGNKTGTWEGVTHDAGFVETPYGVYVIAVLSAGERDWAPITRVSGAVYAVMAP